MQNLTKRQREVFDWIAGFIREKGYCPSFAQIAEGLSLSSLATVHKHVSNLKKRGWLEVPVYGYRKISISSEARGEVRKEVTCPACQHEFRVGA